jgi:hypothetical protein
MEKLMFFIGLVIAYDALLKKYDIYQRITEWGFKGPKILNRISNCEFCARHWLLVPIAILACLLPEIAQVIFYPAIGAGVLVLLMRK